MIYNIQIEPFSFGDFKYEDGIFYHGQNYSNCRLKLSFTCCGIAELGDFNWSPRLTSEDFWKEYSKFIQHNFDKIVYVNRVYSYVVLPKYQVWVDYILLPLGFVETDRFINPNTRCEVIQYTWKRKGT